jgi:hypothetical protein
MASLAMKRAVATALAAASVASAIGAGTASARPMAQLAPGSTASSVDSASVPAPPSSIAAPAGQAYEEVRSLDAARPSAESQPVAGEPSSPSGFDLPSAAIGAASGAGLVLVLLVAVGLAGRRPLTRRHDAARA